MLSYDDVEKILIKEAKTLINQSPEVAEEIMSIVYTFNQRFSGDDFKISKISDIFDLCGEVDKKIYLAPELVGVIENSRKKIKNNMIGAFISTERKKEAYGRPEKGIEISKKEKLAFSVSKIIDLVEKDSVVLGGIIDPAWIKNIDTKLYLEIRNLITDRQTGVQKWEKVKEMLPKNLKESFDLTTTMNREKKLMVDVEPYIELAKNLGPEVVAEYLIHIGAIREKEFAKVLNIISEYLGDVKVPKPNFTDISKIPEAMIKLPSIKRWLFIRFRNRIYQELLKMSGGRDLLEIHASSLEKLEENLYKIIKPFVDEGKKEHKEFVINLIAYFKEAMSLKVPKRMVKTLSIKGKTHLFPSLRQRIAMLEVRGTGVASVFLSDDEEEECNEENNSEEKKKSSKHRRKILEFFMGTGKTASAFLSKEFVESKKMLYLCPNTSGEKKLAEQIADEVGKCYVDGKIPSVGIISSGIKTEELNKVLNCEIVIFPYSMFGGKSKDGERIVDMIKKRSFDFMVVDEIHMAKKAGKRNTEVVYELATQIPGLYDEGHILGLTGNSTPNRPDDIIAQLRLWDKDTYGNIKSVRAAIRRMGPVSLRNAVAEMILLIDEPQDWEKYLTYVPVNLYEDERKIYEAILQNDQMDPFEKLRSLYLAAMNPSLFSPVEEVESAYYDALKSTLEGFLETHDKVVVAENNLKKGLLRELSVNGNSAKTLVEKIKADFGPEVEVYIVDGDNKNDAERKAIFKKSKEKGRK